MSVPLIRFRGLDLYHARLFAEVMMGRLRFAAVLLIVSAARTGIAQNNYRLADPDLKLTRIDSDPKESFLGIHMDPAGRLFVGGRQGLFVYEPDGHGGFAPRQLLVRLPESTWVYDIAVRGDDLYISTVSAIYVIPGGVTHRDHLTPRRLVWGMPLGHVHQSMHGMDWGPQGDLYFTCGDPLWNFGDFRNRPDHWGHWTWFTAAGEKVEYNGVGGVFRIHPDGSGLQVVARGLRNSLGLTFDSGWNLFTSDNDHEQLPADYVPGRLMHVTPHAYFSWPRGWLPSKQPHRPDLLETMNDHLGRYVPVGEVDYEDSYLPEKYRHSLILDRWGEHRLVYYPVQQRGASFKAEEHDLLFCEGDCRPVGVAVGDGCIFVTVCDMAANDSSPVYRSDILRIERADRLPQSSGYDITAADSSKLFAELASPDWTRRHAAHEELLRRNAKVADAGAALRNLAIAENAVWLLAAQGDRAAADALLDAARHGSDAVRLQAINALAEHPKLGAPEELFTQAVEDRDPRIQLAGVLAFFDRDGAIPQAVIEGPARSEDTYLRQAATMLLAHWAPLAQIETLLKSQDEQTRLAGTLAAGFRLTMPGATEAVPASLRLDARSQANSYTVPNFYDSPPVDLRKLGRVGNYTVAQWWKEVPASMERQNLFAMLQKELTDSDRQIRYESAFFLNLLDDSRVQPRIAEVFTEFQPKSLGPRQRIAELWGVGPFADRRRGFNLAHEPEEGPINLAASYPGEHGSLEWKRLTATDDEFDFDRLLSRGTDSSDYVYFRMESAQSQPIVMWTGEQQQIRIWQNGQAVWDGSGRRFKADQDHLSLTLQTGSNDFLVRVHSSSHAQLSLAYEAAQPVHVTLPDRLDSRQLADRLAQAKNSPQMTEIPPEFAGIDWDRQMRSGNIEHGRQLFTSLGCSKCHAITNDSPGGGAPSLAAAGKRFTVAYVVESILLPSKVVSPLFRFTVIRLKSGEVFGGLVVSETADRLDMRLQDTTLHSFRKSDIEARKQQDTSPMPQGLVRTPQELQDLLAYVMSDPDR